MLRFINYPPVLQREDYHELIDVIIDHLSPYKEIKAIYQLGSVRHPGISDLDILCVFENGSQLDLNIHNELPNTAGHILTHGLFGLFEEDVPAILNYSFISDLKLLKGPDVLAQYSNEGMSDDLKPQLALEYLLKMFITLDIQLLYKTLKVRSFLLEARALIFDLELLGIKEGKLFGLIQDVIKLRGQWYTAPQERLRLEALAKEIHAEMKTFLTSYLDGNAFYLPQAKIRIARNTSLQTAKSLATKHEGIILPSFLSFLGRRFFSVQARVSSHHYFIPYLSAPEGSIIQRRFADLSAITAKHRKQIPNFGALTSSLRLF